MKMKIRLVYAALLSVALLLLPQMSGCMSAIQPRSETTGGERAGSETESVKPEERIASLERQLEELRTAQESKNNAYEARIRKLERALSAADAPTAADGLAFTYEENGKGVTLTGWSGNTKTLVIPQTVDGKPVTALGDGLTSALIAFLRSLVFQTAAVMLLPLIFEIDGIWYSIIAAELVSAAVTAVFFAVHRKKYRYF